MKNKTLKNVIERINCKKKKHFYKRNKNKIWGPELKKKRRKKKDNDVLALSWERKK